LAWWIGVFTWVFEEIGVSAWCFCGQSVVVRAATVDTGTTLFEPLKLCRDLKYFLQASKRNALSFERAFQF
jgi:hypothetical protein